MSAYGELLKPEPTACPCGDQRCDKVGQPRAKKMSDGLHHVRGCPCVRCRASRKYKDAHSKQNKGARELGLVTGKFAPSDEENLGGHLRFEHKSGANDAGPIRTRYEACRAQSDAAKAIGDHRPFVAGFTPPGSRLMYVVVRSDDLEAFVLADGYVRGFIG